MQVAYKFTFANGEERVVEVKTRSVNAGYFHALGIIQRDTPSGREWVIERIEAAVPEPR